MNNELLELKKELKEDIQRLRNELCPIGTIQSFGVDLVPMGWLLCDGASYSINDYPDLFNMIGVTFGGDGVSTFQVPDLRGRFVRGWDSDAKIDADLRLFGSTQEDSIQSHFHNFEKDNVEISVSGNHSHTARGGRHDIRSGLGPSVRTFEWLLSNGEDTGETSKNGGHSHAINIINNVVGNVSNTDTCEVRTSIETRPKNIALLYCIRAENLSEVNYITKEGYSTIVERVKNEVKDSYMPLCDTLPVFNINTSEYGNIIDSIKFSFFRRIPKEYSDLVYTTGCCFKEICKYNARIGQVLTKFDDQGLFYLVSWMVDQGIITDKQKNKLIKDVKDFMVRFLATVTPSCN